MKKERTNIKKYIIFAIIAILIILSYFIIKPYLISIITAFILAYLLKPIHERLSKKMPKSISGIICILLMCIIFILPLILLADGIISQASESLTLDKVKGFLDNLSSLPILEKLNINLDSLRTNITSYMISLINSVIRYIPELIVSILIMIMSTYYILTNWDYLSKNLERYIPFDNKKQVAKEISNITNTIVYGSVMIAFVQFFISLLGFYLLGVKYYLFYSAIIFLLAFIPGLGPAIIWVPLSAYYLITQNYYPAIGILIIGIILSVLIETLLKSKIVSSKTKINPLIVLIGILGGVSVFGIFGFIIGPLVLSYTIKILEQGIKNIR